MLQCYSQWLLFQPQFYCRFLAASNCELILKTGQYLAKLRTKNILGSFFESRCRCQCKIVLTLLFAVSYMSPSTFRAYCTKLLIRRSLRAAKSGVGNIACTLCTHHNTCVNGTSLIERYISPAVCLSFCIQYISRGNWQSLLQFYTRTRVVKKTAGKLHNGMLLPQKQQESEQYSTLEHKCKFWANFTEFWLNTSKSVF